VADCQFLGHAHSTVQLHRLLADESCRPADRRLRGRYRPRAPWQAKNIFREDKRQISRGMRLAWMFTLHCDDRGNW